MAQSGYQRFIGAQADGATAAIKKVILGRLNGRGETE
jgi:hypothetical protein